MSYLLKFVAFPTIYFYCFLCCIFREVSIECSSSVSGFRRLHLWRAHGRHCELRVLAHFPSCATKTSTELFPALWLDLTNHISGRQSSPGTWLLLLKLFLLYVPARLVVYRIWVLCNWSKGSQK